MGAIDDLRTTMARLRGPGGCPWDREQTHQSICDCLIEEVAELLEAIDRNDFPHMREELGDLLLHVVMHAQMAAEAGQFNFDDVAREVNEKLVRRHPHVFGEMKLDTSAAVLVQWDAIKAGEKKNGPAPAGVFKPIPPTLSALLFAREVFKQIGKKHLSAEGVVDGAAVAELTPGLDETTAGQKLFELAAACQRAGIDPESALRRHTRKVMDAVERAANGQRPTSNVEQPRANGADAVAHLQPTTANVEHRTSNMALPTAKGERRTSDIERPTAEAAT